jgi:hypothetical protein
MAEGVKVVLHVKMDQAAWEAEYSIDTSAPDYNFEDAVQDWFVGECDTMRDLGDFGPNVERIH